MQRTDPLGAASSEMVLRSLNEIVLTRKKGRELYEKAKKISLR